jgi:hypothetical protein
MSISGININKKLIIRTQLMFTDNAHGALGFHEATTPSLKEGVVHVKVDQYAHLPKLALPENVLLVYYDTAHVIDSTCESLLQSRA